MPADWLDAPLAHGTTWSGPRGSDEWRTTLNVHVLPVRSDEATRSPEAVARAVAVQTRYREGATARVSRGPRVAGCGSWRVEVAFDHAGTRYRRRQYVLQHGEDIVHLDATAPQASWGDVETVLARAVEAATWREDR